VEVVSTRDRSEARLGTVGHKEMSEMSGDEGGVRGGEVERWRRCSMIPLRKRRGTGEVQGRCRTFESSVAWASNKAKRRIPGVSSA
jgi:hypothetical protein